MAHKIRNLTEFEHNSRRLYTECVEGGSGSAAEVLNELNAGIKGMQTYWHGVDAGIRIQEVIDVYNHIVDLRNALAELAKASVDEVCDYRARQIANGARHLEEFTRLNYDTMSHLDEYVDNSDMIDINEAIIDRGLNQINKSITLLEQFGSKSDGLFKEITSNWTEGDQNRIDAETVYNKFVNSIPTYVQTLTSVSQNVTKALQNYNMM